MWILVAVFRKNVASDYIVIIEAKITPFFFLEMACKYRPCFYLIAYWFSIFDIDDVLQILPRQFERLYAPVANTKGRLPIFA